MALTPVDLALATIKRVAALLRVPTDKEKEKKQN